MTKLAILILERETPLCRRFKALLLPYGSIVAEASEAADAIRIFQRQPPDLILVNVSLHATRDGVALTRQIRQQHNTIPLILLPPVAPKIWPSPRSGRGAFTGASTVSAGKVKLADGGTIFFDEIGDMSPDAKAKILCAIESREACGSDPAPSDVHPKTRQRCALRY